MAQFQSELDATSRKLFTDTQARCPPRCALWRIDFIGIVLKDAGADAAGIFANMERDRFITEGDALMMYEANLVGALRLQYPCDFGGAPACDDDDDNKFHVRDGVVLKYAHAGVVRAALNKDSGVHNATSGELRDLMIT
jgi:hypothetical protein